MAGRRDLHPLDRDQPRRGQPGLRQQPPAAQRGVLHPRQVLYSTVLYCTVLFSTLARLETEISLHTEAVLSGRLSEEHQKMQFLQQQQFLKGV